LILIFLVLGTIFLGVATPTEGGALGAVGAPALAAARRRLSWSEMGRALLATTKLASFVMFILIGSTVFSLTFQAVDGPVWVEALFEGLPVGATGFLLFVTALVFVLGFFLDFLDSPVVAVAAHPSTAIDRNGASRSAGPIAPHSCTSVVASPRGALIRTSVATLVRGRAS
jgi:TRAP-type mannitol/chloroaromatic compound transport system permease large subunit